jgi:hypothetical protein
VSPSEAAGIDLGGVTADHAVGLEAIHPSLDRGRAERDAHADALERAARVLAEQRNDLPVDVVHLDPRLGLGATDRS